MQRLLRSGLAMAAGLLLAAAAPAATIPLTATLDCAQATTSGAGCTGTGSATLTLDTDTNQLSWNISFSGLSAPELFSHFHGPALPGVPATVTIGLPLGSPKIGSAILSDSQETQVLDGLWYINVHSQTFPGGEIRGQVLVPEPGTLALLALAAAGLWTARRRSDLPA
jgi:hypothetical protein